MSGRDLVVLGTASQAPTRTRNHNGYLLRWDAEGLLFDPGEGTQRQLLHAGVASSRLTRVLLTHLHGDHCLGLPGVLHRLRGDGVAGPVPIHFPASGRPYVERLVHASIGGSIPVDLDPIDEGPATVEEDPLRITARPLVHPVPTLGWRIEEPPVLHVDADELAEVGIVGPAVGRLLENGVQRVGGREVRLEDVSEVRPGRSAAVVLDTAVCDAAVALAQDVDVLLCEATFLDEHAHLATAYGHLTARQAAGIARDAGARLLVLTHLSSRYPDGDGHRREASEVFEATIVAEDLDIIDIGRR